MNKTFNLLLLTFFGRMLLSAEEAPLAEAPLPSAGGSEKEIVVVNVTNGLHKSNAKEAMEIIEELDPAKTEALIVQIHCLMDTNWDEINLVMGGLGQMTIPTYAFVDSMAVDAGALLAFATDKIYMAPASIIGGSPILGSGNMKAKLESFNLATARAVAMSKGRDAKLVEAIWNDDLEIEWGGKVFSEAGQTLMIEAQDAVLEHEGKTFVAEALVRDVHQLRQHAGLLGNIRFTNIDEPQKDIIDTPLDRVKTKEASFEGKIVVVEIGRRDLVNKARFDYMRRILDRASREKASAVVLDLNTPGGLAWHTGELMMRTLAKLEVPTYAYVNPSAVSAGALIALAADHIYMSPVSAIGAAAVVTPFGDLDNEVERKITSILVPLCRSVARSNEHDPIYASKFMVPEGADGRPSTEQKDDTNLVVEENDDGTFRLKKKDQESGSLLSLAASEATKEWNGAAPLAKGMARSLEDLIAQEGLKGDVIVAEPLGFELLAQWVTRFSALILLLAFVAAQVELRVPGFGVFGFLSLALFGLFFFGHYAAGKLAGFEIVALFLIGIALILVEFIFFPGTLVAGLLGFLCVLTALIYTMADAKVLPSGELSPWQVDFGSVGTSLWNLTIALGGAIVVALLTARFFPESRLFKILVLQAASAPSGSGLRRASGSGTAEETPQTPAENVSAPPLSPGALGTALTDLRPTGSALIDDQVVDVISDAEFVARDSRIEVTTVQGSRVVVRPT